MPRHFQARLPERGDDIEAVLHRAVLDALEQVVPDQVSGGGFDPEPGPQLGGLDVGAMSGLLHPGPRRVVGSAPSVFVVEGVLERAERLLPARRGDVEAPPGLKVASGGQDMDVRSAALLTVEHGGPCVAVGFEPGPGRLLEGVKNGVDLFFGGFVLRCPRDHAGGVLVLEGQRVGYGGHLVRVPAQDFDIFTRLPGRVTLTEEIAGRLAGRSGPVSEEPNQHGCPGFRHGPAPGAPAR